MSEPVSGAPYIIICDSRIGVALGANEDAKIQAVSRGATMLVSFMESHYKHFDKADSTPISTIQHQLMDHVRGEVVLTPEQVEAKIKGLVKEMYVLEKKYD